jgi:hypothetical protein
MGSKIIWYCGGGERVATVARGAGVSGGSLSLDNFDSFDNFG